MTPGLILIGAGGHGRVVLDAALGAGMAVSGIADPALVKGTTVFGVPVLGSDDDVLAAGFAAWLNGIGANPDTARRRALALRVGAAAKLPVLVHPGAVIGREVELADGAQIMAGAVLQCRTAVGWNAVINTGARIDHDCRIAAHVFVGPGAVLSGAVVLGEGSFVGAGAVIVPGVSVGAGAVIGAGAVVTSDVAAGAKVAGCPARPINR